MIFRKTPWLFQSLDCWGGVYRGKRAVIYAPCQRCEVWHHLQPSHMHSILVKEGFRHTQNFCLSTAAQVVIWHISTILCIVFFRAEYRVASGSTCSLLLHCLFALASTDLPRASASTSMALEAEHLRRRDCTARNDRGRLSCRQRRVPARTCLF